MLNQIDNNRSYSISDLNEWFHADTQVPTFRELLDQEIIGKVTSGENTEVLIKNIINI